MPEISPELAARIESLRASHAENPARFFMPLASAYREGGEVGKAEELLRENLKRHPGYLSAHVLLGRCLADRGANAEARNEFQYVLSVDPQNLIALRTLGEMAAASGEPDEARRWFGELLSVDPMNAEAKQSLVALDAAPEAAPEGSEAGGFGMLEPGAGDAPAEDHPAAHADPGTWGEVNLEEHASFSAGDAPAAGEPAPPSFEALDFGAVDLDAQPEAPAAAPGEDAPFAEDASAESEPVDFAPAPAAAPSAGFDAWGSVDDGQDTAEVEPLELEEFYGGDDVAPEPAPAAHAEEHDEHEEVVTETIAELYARQGFPERAAGVYRVLIGRRGEEPALVRRLHELEAQIGAAQGGEADEDRFEPVDLPGDEAAAQPEEKPSWQADETPAWLAAAQADETPSWLSTVDAVAAGGDASADVPAFDDGGMIDFQPDEPQPATEAEPIASAEEPAAAVAATGDAFADSFAYGFAGAASTARAEWEAPRVEETEPAADPAAAEAFAAVAPEDFGASEPAAAVEEPSAAAEEPSESVEQQSESAAAQRGVGESIAAYLSAILAWRPGARADAVAAPSDDASAPPPARPWDEETLGASDEQPPIDEPWIAPDSSSADAAPADNPWSAPDSSAEAPPADEPWSAPDASSADAAPADEPWNAPDSSSADAPAADEPWVAPAPEAEPWAEPSLAEPEPWAAPADEAADEADDEGEELPWLSSEVGTPAAESAPEAEAPMPWETSFELSPEVPEGGPGERPAPRQEPTVEPSGGFSFEEFFSEPTAPAQPAAEPEPEPAPVPEPEFEPLPDLLPPPAAAQPAAPAAAQPPAAEGDDDEDLESFQAWLQSLKR
ncbi:Tetratricopeptide repeat-containing protein [bacterium JGI 053]|nr:Tetratricopeptide repeat-containing protein [bacterium JGI 053]